MTTDTTRSFLIEDESGFHDRCCPGCGRVIYYDYADECYHHLEDPEEGCYVIPAEVNVIG